MNHKFNDGAELFKAIINNPSTLMSLPSKYRYDIEFLEPFYIILANQIRPYIPSEIFQILQHREIICLNQNKTQLTNKPNITLKDELDILHALLTNPKTIETLPTDEKYNSDFLEFLYIIWGDQIEPYIPQEMFEQLKNEALMNEYHQSYEQEHEKWAKEEHQKILSKIKKQ